MGGVVAPQRVLAPRAGGDQPDPQLGQRGGTLECLLQRDQRLLETPGGRRRAASDEQPERRSAVLPPIRQ